MKEDVILLSHFDVTWVGKADVQTMTSVTLIKMTLPQYLCCKTLNILGQPKIW